MGRAYAQPASSSDDGFNILGVAASATETSAYLAYDHSASEVALLGASDRGFRNRDRGDGLSIMYWRGRLRKITVDNVVAMHLLIGSFFYLFIELAGYTVARLVLPPISSGRIRVQPFSDQETGFNGLGYRRDGNGKIELASTTAGLLGLIILLVALFSFWFLVRAVL